MHYLVLDSHLNRVEKTNTWQKSEDIYSDDYTDQSCQMTEHSVHLDLKYQYWHGCLVSMQDGNSLLTNLTIIAANLGQSNFALGTDLRFIIWVMDFVLKIKNKSYYIRLRKSAMAVIPWVIMIIWIGFGVYKHDSTVTKGLKPWVMMMPTLLSLVAPHIVITTTYG